MKVLPLACAAACVIGLGIILFLPRDPVPEILSPPATTPPRQAVGSEPRAAEPEPEAAVSMMTMTTAGPSTDRAASPGAVDPYVPTAEERELALSMAPGPHAIDISTEADLKEGALRFKLLPVEETGPVAPPPDDAFFMFSGQFGKMGGTRGLQNAHTQDKLGVHEDVMRDYQNLRPAFDAIAEDGDARLRAFAAAEYPPPCPGGHWRVLIEAVRPATDGDGYLIDVSAGRACYGSGWIRLDGGMQEVWAIPAGSTSPVLRERDVNGPPMNLQ